MKLTSKIEVGDVIEGLAFCCLGVLILLAFSPTHSKWNTYMTIGGLIGIAIIFGFGACLIMYGVRMVLGVSGYDVDSDLRRVLMWKRVFLRKRFKCIPFNQLKQIRVGCVKKGFVVDHSFFSVFIDGVDGEKEIDCFDTKAEAEKYAGELRTLTGLPFLDVK
jgi:hypothetical protein